MEITETVYTKNRKEWRSWLLNNHEWKKEIWLIYYKKSSGKERIPYDDAVEEALCFGWIDSTVKKIDEEKYAQKFTPRNARSNWSELNIKRMGKLISEGKMTEAGLLKFKPKPIKKPLPPEQKNDKIIIPDDLENALKSNLSSWNNFCNFPQSCQILSIKWISAAKRVLTRQNRIREVVELAVRGEKIVMK